MTAAIDRIQAEIENLSSQDFARLREWLLEKDWERWDQQIETHGAAGKLDFLREEAMAAKANGTLQEL